MDRCTNFRRKISCHRILENSFTTSSNSTLGYLTMKTNDLLTKNKPSRVGIIGIITADTAEISYVYKKDTLYQLISERTCPELAPGTAI